ncbi:MAG: HAD family hydrolase, partial [Candidatus Dormibacteraceae bacterium]
PAGVPLGAGLALARRLALAARTVGGAERRLAAWQCQLAGLLLDLAGGAAWEAAGEDGPWQPEVLARAAALLESAGALPASLRAGVVRLPTCFRSLDQEPADIESLVEKFARDHPGRERPLLVLGLRTSGSYLAPLAGHYLGGLGFPEVGVMTMRPQQRLLAREMGRIRAAVARGSLFLLVDDPPKSGSSLCAAAARLEVLGATADSIVLLLPLLGGGAPPAAGRYRSYLLPWAEWGLHERLGEARLGRVLAELLTGRWIDRPGPDRPHRVRVAAVLGAERLPLPSEADLKAGSPVRRHARALVRVRLRAEGGADLDHLVYVKGVGLGYLGDHSLAVARPLAAFLPDLYGVRDGLLFRAWLPAESRLTVPGAGFEDRVAAYVAARQGALAVETDASAGTAGLNPVWQRGADLMGAGFGRGRPLLRPLLHRLARRLLHDDHPSVVDGSMAISQWFRAPGGEGPVKVDYDERAFSNQDTVVDQLYTYDAAFDLASCAADYEISGDEGELDPDFGGRLRAAYSAVRKDTISDERWLLYQVLHLMGHRKFLESSLAELRAGALPAGSLPGLDGHLVAREVDRAAAAMSRADQRYLGSRFCSDVRLPASGDVCAIDIDGVLETARLQFSSVTPTGALALRSLARHGFRPVLVTGRSLGEVRDRCRAFQLAGGVAEYGAVVYDHGSGSVLELLGDGERAMLDRLRRGLGGDSSIHVDPRFTRVVRASLLDAEGGRRPLPSALVEQELRNLGLEDRVRSVPGYAQTDLVPVAVDKGSGLRRLLAEWGGTAGPPPVAMAIGDGIPDVPMLERARLRFAPANCDPELAVDGLEVLRQRHQGAVAAAAGRLIGHRIGGCPVCAPPPPGADARLLLTVLGVQGEGGWSKLRGAARLAVALR